MKYKIEGIDKPICIENEMLNYAFTLHDVEINLLNARLFANKKEVLFSLYIIDEISVGYLALVAGSIKNNIDRDKIDIEQIRDLKEKEEIKEIIRKEYGKFIEVDFL
ncbi:MAG: hypothetical protein KJI71_01025 [Patescibacteria group bacterium]|nr:hypothetical protein [Patescibacteria group bacterium]